MAKHLGMELGNLEIKNFSDKEIWVKFHDNIRGKIVIIVQSTQAPADNLVELLIAIDAAKRASARAVFVVIPYFGYARQDRKDEPRVAISAKLMANLITVSGADRVITMDLHCSQIQGFFDIPLDHLYASRVLLPYWQEKNIPNLVVVAPDVGSIKMARFWSKKLNAGLAMMDKRRTGHNESEVVNIIGEVAGKNALVVDDMIDTAGTFVAAINTLKNNKAEKIYGSCIHPVCSGEAYNRLYRAPLEELVVTDTIPFVTTPDKFKTVSVAGLLATAAMNAATNQSISSLFDKEEMRR